MQSQSYLAVTSLGKYNPYIIADITSAVTDAGLNIVGVEQNSVHGLNIVVMIAETIGAEDTLGSACKRLRQKVGQLDGDVRVEVVTALEAKPRPDKSLQVFTIIGRDKVGILKAITNALANFRVSIERMHHLAMGELVVLELWLNASELRDLSVLKEVIHDTCARVGFDTIIQPESPYRQRRRLVVFDMDNTIIDGEVINELAKAARVDHEVAEITKKAMAGELDYAESLRRRVALLKGLSVEALKEVAASMKLTAGAQDVIRTLKGMGFKTALISGGFHYFATQVKEKLGFDYVYANTLEIKNGVVTGRIQGEIIDKEGKGRILQEIAEKEGLTLEEVVAVGDGANDEIMLRNAGFGIAFNAYEILQQVADGRLTRNNLHGLLYCLGATEATVRSLAREGELNT